MAPGLTLRPARALLHPAWLGALALLALNDHVLKGAGVLPGWLTGKLSDVAGLLVAPALLATLLGARSRRAVAACHAAVGAVFALLELAPAAAALADRAMAAAGVPWRSFCDPTDLLALLALAASWRVLVPAMARPLAPCAPRRAGERAAAALGLLFCAATSVDPYPCADDPEACGCDEADPAAPCAWERPDAALYLHNGTDSARTIWVRRAARALDCDAVAEDPARLGRDEDFGPRDGEVVAANGVIPLAEAAQGECDALWVETEGLPPVVLFWDVGDYPPRPIPAAPAAGATMPPGGVAVTGLDGALDWRQLGDGPGFVFPVASGE